MTRQLDIVSAENITLNKKIIVLEARLAEYETPKDSHNSGTPSSRESIKAQTLRATRYLRKKSGKATGRQKGHEGYTLGLATTPDLIEEHQPCYFTHCGKDLSKVEGSMVEIRQNIDIPLSISPIVTEHRIIGKTCSCGHRCQIGFLKTVRSNIS